MHSLPQLNLGDVSNFLLSYSDEPDQITFQGPVVAVSAVTVIGITALFASLAKQAKPTRDFFDLTEQEIEAIDYTNSLFDDGDDLQLTESGTKGAKKRKAVSEMGIKAYKKENVGNRNARGKTLTYAEVDLGLLATLLRYAAPKRGEVFMDIGSGVGRACAFAASMYPFSKCVGVEFLPELHAMASSTSMKGKMEWVNADYMDPEVTVDKAGVVFAYASYFSSSGQTLTELSEKLSSVKRGTRIITIDKKLSGPFELLETVEDPRGDYQLNTGYVWQKV